MKTKSPLLKEIALHNKIDHYNINVGELLLKFAQKSQDVFWIKNHDYSKQIYLSPSYKNIWEQDPNTIINNSNIWIDCIHPEDKEKVKRSLNERKPKTNTNKTFFLTYRIITPSNKTRWIKDESFAIYDNQGKHIAFAGIAQEITKEKELEIAKEEAKIANKAKSEFLANVSHDLRTPLNWLLGAAEILKKNNTNPDHNNLLDILINGGNRIKNMVEEILDYSRLELKMLPLESKNINLKKIIEESVQMFKNTTHLAIIIDYPSHIPSLFLGDKYALLRIFNNLLDNAFKFTHTGYILINVSKKEISERKTSTLQISIEDSGIGIPADKLKIIFDKFEKVEPSYKNSYHGIGLGLTIVKKFLDSMNGKIIAKSKPFQGSKFILTLPFQLQKKQNPIKTKNKIKLKILIIDDIKKRALSYKNMLKQHNVICISSKKLFELFNQKQNDYNLIIIDANLNHNNKKIYLSLSTPNNLALILHNNMLIKDNTNHQAQEKNIKHLFVKPILPSKNNHLFYNTWLTWHLEQYGIINTIKKLSPKILLIEDQLLSQKITYFYLNKEFNCQVDQATTANYALSLTSTQKYDLILMDIGLPDACGINTAKRIHSQSLKINLKTPIVALTAHASAIEKNACSKAGMADFITKPISMQNLKQVLYQQLLC